MNTYNSNHILSELSLDYIYLRRPLPIDLASALQINRENGVSQAARLKIIKTHFSGNPINVKPFADMDKTLLPIAIAWMAKDDTGISVLYQFVRSMPTLLEKQNRKARSVHQILHGNGKKFKTDASFVEDSIKIVELMSHRYEFTSAMIFVCVCVGVNGYMERK
jgi:hypothetical protein